MKLSEVAHRVIDLARKIREYYETELPKYHPNYPFVGLDDVTAPPPSEERELRDFLSTLPNDQIYQLLSIMYLGREDFGTADLAGSYETLAGTSDDPAYAVSEMMHQAPLADYLSDGLEELRKQRIDVDKLPLKKVKVRKR